MLRECNEAKRRDVAAVFRRWLRGKDDDDDDRPTSDGVG
jgi:hypothetical protein